MKDRRAARTVAGLDASLTVAAACFDLANRHFAVGVVELFTPSFLIVALIIIRSLPRHAVAWTYLVAGAFGGVAALGHAVAGYGVSHGWHSGLPHVAAWIYSNNWEPGTFLLLTFGLLRFPDGRRLSPRWRLPEYVAVAATIGLEACNGIAAWGNSTRVLLSNATPHVAGWRGALLLAGFLCFLGYVPVVLAAAVGLALRWRRSGFVVRQQIRWVVAAAAVAAVLAVFQTILGNVLGRVVNDSVATVTTALGLALIAAATGIAITRYRLYEIDRIISRTLGWTMVTALLIGVYVGLAASAAAVSPHRYGSLGVAAATLAVAALFVPVRRKIQRAVDRRFDRAGYDAARVVEAFAARVRGSVAAAGLDAELMATVDAAVAPASASIWLVPAG